MPLFERVRACDLYDIRLVCLKGTTLYHSDCFLEIKQMRNMEGKRWDRKSEIASFRKKKYSSNTSSYFERYSEIKD